MPTRSRRGPVGVLIVTAAAAVLIGCANPSGPPPSAGVSPSTASTADLAAPDHNDVDVTFLQEMIPHHTQAIAMSRLAATRAGSAQVKDLAIRIERAQGRRSHG